MVNLEWQASIQLEKSKLWGSIEGGEGDALYKYKNTSIGTRGMIFFLLTRITLSFENP